MKKTILLFITGLICHFAFTQSYINYTLQSSIDRVQPMTGVVFWTNNSSDLNQLENDVQLEFSYLIFSDVVNDTEGEYDWSVVEQRLNSASNRGHQCILRFRYCYPGQTYPSVPAYIRNRSDYTDQSASIEGSYTFIPDWSNATLQQFTLDFFEEFAKEYDNDPRLAFVQVGFGSYAEYHLYAGPLDLGRTFPTKNYQTQFLNHLGTHFKLTPWNVSIDAADGSRSPFSSNQNLKNLQFGLFDDSFMHSNHSNSNNEYNRASWLFFSEDRWKENVAGGEFSYYSNYDQRNVLNLPDGPHGRSFESFADQYHITYIIGNDQLNYQPQSRIKSASMAMGYKFEVTEFKSDGNETIVTIENNGIAPIYFDAFPKIDGTRSTLSLKGLLPGESRIFTIATGLTESSELTIDSDRLVNGQVIQYNADLTGTILGNEEFSNAFMITYPNPIDNYVFVKAPDDELKTVSLHSLDGKKIETDTIIEKKNEVIKIDFSNLENGIYFLKTKSLTKKIYKK